MSSGLVGLIANPAAGRDIRRLTAHASVVPNHEKAAIVRRVLRGIAAAGAGKVAYLPDLGRVMASALDGAEPPMAVEPLPMLATGQAEDSSQAARLLTEAGAAVIVTLGGDGTNRAVAAGCQDVPVVAISTGTNNVFPTMIDGTVAGLAAGLLAASRVDPEAVTQRTKRVVVSCAEGEDFALVDAASCRERFVGSRAIWEPGQVRRLVLTRADAWNVGLSAIAGALCPVGASEPAGLLVELGDGPTVTVPLAPGLVTPVPVTGWRRLALGERVRLSDGGGTVALDGERELTPFGPVTASVTMDGPRVVDIRAALRAGALPGRARIEKDAAALLGSSLDPAARQRR
jgi:predicted polyphosphate/ATP-dependent NAD kinase